MVIKITQCFTFKQAARLLSSFSFRGVPYIDLTIYYDAKYCFWYNISSSGKHDLIVTWKKDDWLAFISARSFNNEGITSDKIRCIRIFFRADDGRMYSIELYPHGIRLIIYDNLREYWLTPTEKRLIHGVCDVIKLSRLVSSCELVHVITDLPQVEVDDRDATGNSVPLFWIHSNWF